MTRANLLETDFATLPDLVRAHAAERPDAIAAADPARRLSWSELDEMVDRIAARLQAQRCGSPCNPAQAGGREQTCRPRRHRRITLSAVRHVDRKAAERGLLVGRFHVLAGLLHRPDHRVQ